MTKLTTAQIKGLAYGVGLDDNQASIMTAIALAESGGNTDSHNPIPPDDSYGLWQINMLGSMGTSRRKALGLPSNSALYDPSTNAVAMKYIYSRQGYKAWSTYGGPKYQLFISKAKAAKPDSSMLTQGGSWWDWATSKDPWNLVPPKYEKSIPNGVGGSSDPVGGALNNAVDSTASLAGQVGNVANAVSKAGDWLSNATNWLRILYVGGGAVVLVLAMQSLFKPVTDAAIGGTAKTAATIAKAVK
jgi:hypothetical protein